MCNQTSDTSIFRSVLIQTLGYEGDLVPPATQDTSAQMGAERDFGLSTTPSRKKDIDRERNSRVSRTKARLLVYFNHLLSSLDDTVWGFALGLFLMEITPESLQFTASYGLAAGGAVLLFSIVVGNWVDTAPRLSVARTSVIVQNLAVILCSLVIFVVLTFKEEIVRILPNEGLLRISYCVIIVLAILSNVFNMAKKTAIERDWIAEICMKDKDLLATFSATMRRIDLLTMVLAPIVVGQIMTNTSHGITAIVIVAWNFLTIFVEYVLLWKMYNAIPELQADKFEDKRSNQVKRDENHEIIDNLTRRPGGSSWLQIFASCVTLYRGWTVYRKYDAAFAGIGLASLYLTVLGFDGITTGFAYSQGLSESLIGVLMAASGFTGIVGTILYPIVRRRVGIQRTGLYSLTAQITSLILCIISIWSPGSPFDPYYFTRERDIVTNYVVCKNETSLTEIWETLGNHSNAENHKMGALSCCQNISHVSFYDVNNTVVPTSSQSKVVEICSQMQGGGHGSYVSIALLMSGIIGARIGLWMSDLTINQLFLETVHVRERGIVNGIQNVLNQVMDMLKFTIVILLPVPEVFGFLIIISFCFICLGWVLFAVYVKRARGYILPCYAKAKEKRDFK